MKSKILCTIWCLFFMASVGFCQETENTIKQEISIDDVTQLALENSLDIQIAQYDAYIKRVSLMKAQSIFDAFFNASIGYTDDRLKQSSTIFGNRKY